MIDTTQAAITQLWAQLAARFPTLRQECPHDFGPDLPNRITYLKRPKTETHATPEVASRCECQGRGWVVIDPNATVLQEAMKAEGWGYDQSSPPDDPLTRARYWKLRQPGWEPYHEGLARDAHPLLANLLAATEAVEKDMRELW